MRRKLTAALSVILAAVTLAGCGGNVSNQTNAAQEQTDTAQTSETPQEPAAEDVQETSDEIVEIFWQYPSYGEVSEGFYDMENALNERMEKDIGVHVTFVPTGLDTSQQDAILQVSAGEQLDVCLSAFTSMSTLVNKGLILPLDEILVKTGAGEILKEHNADPFARSTYAGQVYGIPVGDKTFNMFSYILKKPYAEKYGFTADPDKYYTMDEIEDMFAVIKEGEGPNVYMNIPWNNTYEPLNYGMCEYDKLGGDMSYGVLMLNRGFDETKVQDLFETEEYAEYCDRMYRWAQKGYMAPDAAVNTDAITEISTSDKYVGWMAYGAPNDELLGYTWDDEVTQFKVIEPYVDRASAGINWSIPITSVNPEKAVEAVAYIYENPDAAWLIQYGIEGENWVITERNEDGVAGEYTDEVSNLAYVNPYGLWGNVLETVAIGGPVDKNTLIRKAEQDTYASGRVTPAAGYVFDATNVSAEVAAVQTVIAQYAPSLNAGALDPSKALPEFIDSLKSAGIDKIIEENQAQLDAWLANK